MVHLTGYTALGVTGYSLPPSALRFSSLRENIRIVQKQLVSVITLWTLSSSHQVPSKKYPILTCARFG